MASSLPVLLDPPETLRYGPTPQLKQTLVQIGETGHGATRDRERGREQHDVLARADGQGRQIEGGAAGRPAGVQEIDTQIYGNAFTAKMSLDRQIVGSSQRLPGIPSSGLGLDVLNNSLYEFTPEDIYNLRENDEEASIDESGGNTNTITLHEVIEQKMGISSSKTVRL